MQGRSTAPKVRAAAPAAGGPAASTSPSAGAGNAARVAQLQGQLGPSRGDSGWKEAVSGGASLGSAGTQGWRTAQALLAEDGEVAADLPLTGVASAQGEALGRASGGAGAVGTLGRVFGAAGAVGGALQVGQGIGEFDQDPQQGTLDIAAGGLGAGVGVAAASGVACPVLAPLAVAASLDAYGNRWSKEHGKWGTDASGHARSGYDWAADNTSMAYDATNELVGGGTAGKVAGGVVGGIVGAGSYLDATIGNIWYGIEGAASDVGQGIGHLFGKGSGAR